MKHIRRLLILGIICAVVVLLMIGCKNHDHLIKVSTDQQNDKQPENFTSMTSNAIQEPLVLEWKKENKVVAKDVVEPFTIAFTGDILLYDVIDIGISYMVSIIEISEYSGYRQMLS